MPLILWTALIVLVMFGAPRLYRSYRRRQRRRHASRARAGRLAGQYLEAEPPGPAAPLVSIPGRVATGDDGLYLSFGRGAPFHLVPWGSVRSVIPGPTGGSIVLEVAGVGDVSVPGSLGRSVWDHTLSEGAAGPPPPRRRSRRSERSRAGGV